MQSAARTEGAEYTALPELERSRYLCFVPFGHGMYRSPATPFTSPYTPYTPQADVVR